MDFGVKVGGYCSDLQRIHYILDKGEIEPPASVKRGFNTLIKAVEEARKLIKPGNRGEIVDRTAREIITSELLYWVHYGRNMEANLNNCSWKVWYLRLNRDWKFPVMEL
jgi:Xaa-Pro aminopeptidase